MLNLNVLPTNVYNWLSCIFRWGIIVYHDVIVILLYIIQLLTTDPSKNWMGAL